MSTIKESLNKTFIQTVKLALVGFSIPFDALGVSFGYDNKLIKLLIGV